MRFFDLLNPFWSEQLDLRSPYRPHFCRELLRELGPAPLFGPAKVHIKRNGDVTVQLRGFGNSGWKPRATVSIGDAPAGGTDVRIRLDRAPGIKFFWILWPLVWVWIVLDNFRHAPIDPLAFLEVLAVALLFAEFPALLTALVWDREPAKLIDAIKLQLRADDGDG